MRTGILASPRPLFKRSARLRLARQHFVENAVKFGITRKFCQNHSIHLMRATDTDEESPSFGRVRRPGMIQPAAHPSPSTTEISTSRHLGRRIGTGGFTKEKTMRRGTWILAACGVVSTALTIAIAQDQNSSTQIGRRSLAPTLFSGRTSTGELKPVMSKSRTPVRDSRSTTSRSVGRANTGRRSTVTVAEPHPLVHANHTRAIGKPKNRIQQIGGEGGFRCERRGIARQPTVRAGSPRSGNHPGRPDEIVPHFERETAAGISRRCPSGVADDERRFRDSTLDREGRPRRAIPFGYGQVVENRGIERRQGMPMQIDRHQFRHRAGRRRRRGSLVAGDSARHEIVPGSE